MAINTTTFDFASRIKTDEDVRAYLQVFLEENGIDGFLRAIKYIAKADIPNSCLAKTLREAGSVSIESIDDIVHSLGFRLTLDKAA